MKIMINSCTRNMDTSIVMSSNTCAELPFEEVAAHVGLLMKVKYMKIVVKEVMTWLQSVRS